MWGHIGAFGGCAGRRAVRNVGVSERLTNESISVSRKPMSGGVAWSGLARLSTSSEEGESFRTIMHLLGSDVVSYRADVYSTCE